MTIDGFGPLPVLRPTTIDDLRQAVVSASGAIYPVGGGTMLDYGLPPTKAGTAIDLTGLNRVIDYPARDMTITVQAGITIAALQKVLAAEGQQLPVDVPLPDRATLGGAIATNASGLRRFGYGTLRDYVIGISAINDNGEEIKGGGRVVKNVAGYDMMKLLTGSLGTLGIISQVTLKVKPLAESVGGIVVNGSLAALEPLVRELLPRTRTRPTVVTLATSSGGRADLLIAFEEKAVAVDWQLGQLQSELPAEFAAASRVLRGEGVGDVVKAWTDFPVEPAGAAVFKANMLPAQTMAFVRQAVGLDPAPELVAHVGNGIVFGRWAAGMARETVQAALVQLGRWAENGKGNCVVTRCPSDWKAVLPVWGRSTPDRALMKAVKDKLDPRRLFNPGRFVDGI